MLDLALLSANATQLKFILQMGPTYDFYTLLLSLVIVSIILQVRFYLFNKFYFIKIVVLIFFFIFIKVVAGSNLCYTWCSFGY